MSEAKHTPLLPLRLEGPSGRTLVDAGGQPIVSASRPSAERTEILRLIVRAVNSYEAMREALQAIVNHEPESDDELGLATWQAYVLRQAKAALKLAQQGEGE